MRRPLMPHPEEEQLIRYTDGELAAGAAGRVRSHLEACWQCRAATEEIQEAVRHCVQYRKDVLGQLLPAPPAPWADIYSLFDQADASLAQDSLNENRRKNWIAALIAWPAHHVKAWAPAALA